jgi:hypothetical protein
MSRTPSKSRPEPQHDPVAPWCGDVLRLFAGSLAAVRFPDVDEATLVAAADALRAAQVEIERLERELDEARGRLREQNTAFAEQCGRALAYARVYASTQPELQPEVEAVRPVATRTSEPEPKRRGRPRKDVATVELLPDDVAAAQ